MTRSLRSLMMVGAVVTVAACSEVAPTAPGAAPAAAASENLVAAAAPAPSGSCTITPSGASYDVTVTWSGLSPTLIELWQLNASQPILQAVLTHAHRKGSVTYTVATAPDYALVVGSQIGFKVLCTTGV